MNLFYAFSAVAIYFIASCDGLDINGVPGFWERRLGAAACPKSLTINRQAFLSGMGLQCTKNDTELELFDMKALDGNQLTMHLSGGKPAAKRAPTAAYGEIFIATLKAPINCVNRTTPFKFDEGEVLNFFRPTETAVIHFSEVFAKPAAGHSAEEGHADGAGHKHVAAVRQLLASVRQETHGGGDAKKNGAEGHSDTGGGHKNGTHAAGAKYKNGTHAAGAKHKNGTTGHAEGEAGHSTGSGHSSTPCGAGRLACQPEFAPVSAEDAANGKAALIGLRAGDRAQLKGGVAYMAFGSECLYEQTSQAACFPADAQVALRDGRTVRMEDVRIGDEVSVGAGRFSRVFFWTHFDKSVTSDFVRLTTESGRVLEASPGHFVYASGNKMVTAGSVKVGDMIPMSSGMESRVVDVSSVAKSGLFNPQTLCGDIAVNGIVASTYTESVEPKMAHALLTPLRMVTRTIESAVAAKLTV